MEELTKGYDKTTWVNEETPLNAENMDKIENELVELNNEKLDKQQATSFVVQTDLSLYMTIAEMENYVPYEIFRLALDRITELEKIVDALPDYEELPKIGLITPISENKDGSYFLRWTATDPASRDMRFHLKVGTQDFKEIYPLQSQEFYTYFGDGAVRGNNPSYIKVSNGQDEIISDVFSIDIPKDPSIVPPTVSQDIQNIEATVDEVIDISYMALESKTSLVKHEFSDGAKVYDITDKVLTVGDRYIYKTSYGSPIDISNAFITVYNADGLKAKSNDFAITVSEKKSPPTLASFEIIPSDYKTEEDTIKIRYKTDKKLENVKISLNGEDYTSALSFNQDGATFSVKGLANGNYTAKLRGYYKEEL